MSLDFQRYTKWFYSFRVLIAIQAFVCTLLLLVFNRWVSQNLVWDIVHDKLQTELIVHYAPEREAIHPPSLLGSPGQVEGPSMPMRFNFQQSFIDQVVQHSLHCAPQGGVESTERPSAQDSLSRQSAQKLCLELNAQLEQVSSWKTVSAPGVKAQARSASINLQGQPWMVVELAPSVQWVQADNSSSRSPAHPKTWVAVPESAMGDYVDLIWDIRDKVLVQVLPVLLISVLLTSLLVTRTVINPLEKLKHRLFQLETKDLDKPLHAQSRFNEFKDFVDVFNLLRERLRASFFQAGRFSADASHELRTPLTILRGYAERAIADCEEGSRQQIRLSQMSDEIDRLISITDKLLLLSKADAGSLTLSASQVNISDMLDELVMDANMFQDKLRVTSRIEKSMFWYCDAQLIQQLIHNLYTNAVNYNIDHGWIHFEAHVEQGELVIAFSNPTPKLSHDLVERAFERFYRGIDSHTRLIDGHGLGLSLCKEIARVHYAEIEMVEEDQNVVTVTLRVDPKALMHTDLAPVAHLLETA
jgi:signal transduction histidine kinase